MLFNQILAERVLTNRPLPGSDSRIINEGNNRTDDWRGSGCSEDKLEFAVNAYVKVQHNMFEDLD